MKPLFLAAAAAISMAASLTGCKPSESEQDAAAEPPSESIFLTSTLTTPPTATLTTTPTVTLTTTPKVTLTTTSTVTPPTTSTVRPTLSLALMPPEGVVVESIANGISSTSLENAVKELSAYLAGMERPCAASYREYAANVAQANPPLTPDELRYVAGQLAWSSRDDVAGDGCTEPEFPDPPIDPGGHAVDLLDGSGPHLNPDPPTTTGFRELPGWTVVYDEPVASGQLQCYSAGNPHRPTTNGTPDWGLIPPIDPATAASGMTPTLRSNAVPANPANPYRTLAPDGSYGWQVTSSPARCYFVTITRADQVRYSPPVGVWPDQPVSDLHHCWETNRWYSDIDAPCP